MNEFLTCLWVRGRLFLVANLTVHAAMAFVFALMFEISSQRVELKPEDVCRELEQVDWEDETWSMSMDLRCRLTRLERSRTRSKED